VIDMPITRIVMKALQLPVNTLRGACRRRVPGRAADSPLRRPVASVIPLRRSPLARLAWIFGFGR
jgi:hypothetical protein